MEKTTSSLIMFQVFSEVDKQIRGYGVENTTPLILLFQVYSEVDTRIRAYAVKNITQSFSKTHQRESKRGSGQTSLGSARIIILTRRRSKSSLQYKSIWRLEVRSTLGLGLKLSLSNGSRILNKDLFLLLVAFFFF